MDGSPVHYAAWEQNEPSFAYAQENCVILNKKDGELFFKKVFLRVLLFLFAKNILPAINHSFPAICENMHNKV